MNRQEILKPVHLPTNMVHSNGLTITRVFDAPVEKVWRYWSDPEYFRKWWGPKDFTCPTADIDFRVGGKYHVAMHGPAGSEWDKDLWSGGIYEELVPFKKIVVSDGFSDELGNRVSATYYGMPATIPMESRIELSFEQVDGKTKMILYYPSVKGFESELKNMTQGWNQSLDKLEENLKE